MSKIKSILLIIISAVLFVLVVFAFLGPFSKISSVELKTDQDLKNTSSYAKKEKQILSYLNSYKGQRIWTVDLKALVQKINDLYWGSEVYAFRKFPGQLVISLKKKSTALLLLKAGATFYSVSYEAEIGSLRNTGESFDFPILRGTHFWNSLSLRKKALFILSAIPKEGQVFSVQNVSEISYNKLNDSLYFYLISHPFILELKKRPNSEKIKNINFVLNYLNQQGAQGGLIDARLDKKIIVKNSN